MFTPNKLIGLAGCFFIMSGCAIPQLSNDHAKDVAPALDAQYSSENVGVLYQLGRSYQKEKNYAKAADVYKKALEINPDYLRAYNGLGVVYSLQGKHELAIQLINKAVRLKPMASHLHNNLGFAYLTQGNMSAAADAFERALQLNPENAHARSNLATALKRMNCADSQPCGRWQEPGRSN